MNGYSLATHISDAMAFAASHPWLILFVIAFLSIFLIGVLFSGKCPLCGSYHSFKKTGATRREGNFIFGTTYDEHQCIQCGHTGWVQRTSNLTLGSGGGRGGGCGG